MATIISVEHLSKEYRLGLIGGAMPYEDLSRWWARMRKKPGPLLPVGQEHHPRRIGDRFWALDDVSFQVEEGEVLGIIGRNGAGKSTLLKIMSQVTAPTSGPITFGGRASSLIEVGTGFHLALRGSGQIPRWLPQSPQLIPEKGIDSLIEAAALVLKRGTDVSFIHVGDGPCAAEYKGKVEHLGIQKRFVFAGLLNLPEAGPILRQSDVSTLPSTLGGKPSLSSFSRRSRRESQRS